RVFSLLTTNALPVHSKKIKIPFRTDLDVNQNKILQKILCDDFTLIRAQHGTGMTTVFAAAAALSLKAGHSVLYVSSPVGGTAPFLTAAASQFDTGFVLDLTEEDMPAADPSFKGLFRDHDTVYEKTDLVERVFREIDSYYETLEGGKRIVTSFLLASERYVQMRAAHDGIIFSPEQIGLLSDDMVKTWFSTVSEIDQTLAETGPVNVHPLRLIRQMTFSYEYKSRLIDLLDAIVQSLDSLASLREKIRLRISDSAAFTSKAQLEALVELGRLMSGDLRLPVRFFEKEDRIDDSFRRITALIQAKKENDGIAESVFLSFEDGIVDLEAADLLEQWNAGSSDKGLRAISRRRGIVKAVKRYLKPNFDVENVEYTLTKLVAFKGNKRLLDEEQGELFSLLGVSGDDGEVWDRFSAVNDLCYQVYNVYLSAFDREGIGSFLAETAKLSEETGILSDLLTEYASYKDRKAELEKAVCQSLDSFFADLNGDGADHWAGIKDALTSVLVHMDDLKSWCDWLFISNKAEEIGLKNVVNALEFGRVPVEELKKAFLRAFFKGVCEYNFMVSPSLVPGKIDFEEEFGSISAAADGLKAERKAEVDSLLSVNKLDALSKLKAPTPPLTLLKERP
ncbi:MAG: hypothetical protein II776_05575, partial [Clostridia bacterium]|nr:hypothetical protein [Clostridia bacterium]